jgi:hypothetical protein
VLAASDSDELDAEVEAELMLLAAFAAVAAAIAAAIVDDEKEPLRLSWVKGDMHPPCPLPFPALLEVDDEMSSDAGTNLLSDTVVVIVAAAFDALSEGKSCCAGWGSSVCTAWRTCDEVTVAAAFLRGPEEMVRCVADETGGDDEVECTCEVADEVDAARVTGAACTGVRVPTPLLPVDASW